MNNILKDRSDLPQVYSDLSSDEMEFLLLLLNILYEGVDNPGKKSLYYEKAQYLQLLIKEKSQ